MSLHCVSLARSAHPLLLICNPEMWISSTKLLLSWSWSQDLHLGSISGSDAEMRFQKRHAQKLPEVTVAYLRDTLQVPLWFFGADLPGPLPEPSFSQGTNLDKHVSSPKAQVIAVVSAGSAEAITATAKLQLQRQFRSPCLHSHQGDERQSMGIGIRLWAAAHMCKAVLNKKMVVTLYLWFPNAGEFGVMMTSPAFIDEWDSVSPDQKGVGAHCKTHVPRKGLMSYFHCKGSAPGTYRAEGHCKETTQCPVKYWGRVYVTGRPRTVIRAFGEHDHAGQAVGYGSIFTAAMHVAAQNCSETWPRGPYTVQGLRDAFMLAKIPDDKMARSQRMDKTPRQASQILSWSATCWRRPATRGQLSGRIGAMGGQ